MRGTPATAPAHNTAHSTRTRTQPGGTDVWIGGGQRPDVASVCPSATIVDSLSERACLSAPSSRPSAVPGL
eukprot:5585369-Prymnesium_polylepis.1